jgi:hypothetical protein
VRKGTLIAVIVLFLLLIGAAFYQFSLGNKNAPRYCGPTKAGAQPTPGACDTPSSTP